MANHDHAVKRGEIFHRIAQHPAGGPVVKPNKALALTEDNRVVNHTDQDAAYVLCGEHSTLPKDVADELGITEHTLTPEEQAESDARRYAARGNFGPQDVSAQPIEPVGAEKMNAEEAATTPAQMSFGGKKK